MIPNYLFEHSGTVPVGEVIRTVPEDGVPVPPDFLLTVYISLGPGGWFTLTANRDEAQRTRYSMFLAVDFDFPSGHVRLWSGFGQLTLLGNVFLGAGKLGRVSSEPERSNLVFERKTYQLAGAEVNPALVDEVDLDASFGRPVTEYFGFLNYETHQLLADPEVNWEGEISNIRRADGAQPMIEVNAEHRMIMLDGNDGWRWTHEHQKIFSSNDLGFNLVPTIETKEVLWGGKRVIPGTGGGGGHGGGGGRDRDRGGNRP